MQLERTKKKMNWTDEYTAPRWEVVFKRGAGRAIVAGSSEKNARNAALAEYRRKLGYVDFCKPNAVIESMVLLDVTA